MEINSIQGVNDYIKSLGQADQVKKDEDTKSIFITKDIVTISKEAREKLAELREAEAIEKEKDEAEKV